MNGRSRPLLIEGDPALVGAPAALDAALRLTAAAAEQGWYAAVWDRATGEVSTTTVGAGGQRRQRRLRLRRAGHLEELVDPAGHSTWRPLPVTGQPALLALAGTRAPASLTLSRPRTGDPGRYRVDLGDDEPRPSALFRRTDEPGGTQ